MLPAGTDLADAIAGFGGPGDYPALVSALEERGYSGSVLSGLLSENFLRLFRHSLPAGQR
jgi:microsomal dipeptidase-like Zn-dependent dipeptidase